jgi:hypothetical protein
LFVDVFDKGLRCRFLASFADEGGEAFDFFGGEFGARVGEVGGEGAFDAAAEEGFDDAFEGAFAGFFDGAGGSVEEGAALLFVTEDAFVFEDAEEGADGGAGGGIVEAFDDGFGGEAGIGVGVDGFHDLAFAAGELTGVHGKLLSASGKK